MQKSSARKIKSEVNADYEIVYWLSDDDDFYYAYYQTGFYGREKSDSFGPFATRRDCIETMELEIAELD